MTNIEPPTREEAERDAINPDDAAFSIYVPVTYRQVEDLLEFLRPEGEMSDSMVDLLFEVAGQVEAEAEKRAQKRRRSLGLPGLAPTLGNGTYGHGPGRFSPEP